MILRQGHPSDLPYLYDICHRTGESGEDASASVSDRLLLGHYFAAPYLVHDPAWCWVAEDDLGPAGYLVTTPDSRVFAAWMNERWLPGVRTHYPETVNLGWTSFEAWIRQTIAQPAGFPDFVDAYPAHLHIDLLPRAQGQGLGSRMFALFQEKLRAEGIVGFHLGVGTQNSKAQGFYARQGLGVIRQDPGVIYLGITLEEPRSPERRLPSPEGS